VRFVELPQAFFGAMSPGDGVRFSTFSINSFPLISIKFLVNWGRRCSIFSMKTIDGDFVYWTTCSFLTAHDGRDYIINGEQPTHDRMCAL